MNNSIRKGVVGRSRAVLDLAGRHLKGRRARALLLPGPAADFDVRGNL